MDFSEAKQRIEVNPGINDWWVSTWDGEYTLGIEEDPILDADKPGTVPGGVCVNLPYPPSNDTELAQDLVVAKMSQALHEGLEWVKVGGKRIGNPHPQDYYDMEAEVVERCRAIVKDACARLPLPQR